MRKPATPADLGFTARDRRQLSRALGEAQSIRTFRRLQAVLLIAQGYSTSESAQITGLSRRSVYHLVKRYLASHLVVDLLDPSFAGRPPVAPRITPARILAELKRSPLRLGYRTNVWTVELLADRLHQQYDCPISPRTLRRRMRQMGLRCKRPRYVYSEKEPNLAQKKGRLSAG
jgi:transposase